MDLLTAEWLRVLRSEYLDPYVYDGGAAVKFAVPAEPDGRAALQDGLNVLGRELSYQVVTIDARHHRLHLIDRLFFAVAAQIDWQGCTDAYLRRLLSEHGYHPPPHGPIRLDDLAAAGGISPADLPEMDRDIQNLLRQSVLHDYDLAYEFRVAMLRLCQARLQPEGPNADQMELIRLWLQGELRSLTPLKPALIYQKIARHNARHLLFSLARWLHLAGQAGLLLCLDITRYTEGARPPEPDGTLYYSSAATLDLYEVLRQFIDATDELEYCLIVVIAARSFLEDERRGLDRYDALKLRIWDEVHDRRRANPLASLVRLAPLPSAPPVAPEPPGSRAIDAERTGQDLRIVATELPAGLPAADHPTEEGDAPFSEPVTSPARDAAGGIDPSLAGPADPADLRPDNGTAQPSFSPEVSP